MPLCIKCSVPLDPKIRNTVCISCGWEPSPGPQATFLASRVYEKLYGGAAGGGKTDALVMNALKYIHLPHYNAIIFRRTFPELIGQVIPKAIEWYTKLGGVYNQQNHCFTFKSGARIHFGHLQHEDDVHRYQGWEFQLVEFDELTSFTEKQYRYMLSRLRSAHGIPTEVASATNPGNEGHEWVVNRWAPFLRIGDDEWDGPICLPGETAWYVNRGEEREWVTREEAQEINAEWERADPYARANMPRALTTTFIPAKLEDNPHLLVNDPEYGARLQDLDRHTYEQLRNGNWLSKPARGDYFQRAWFELIDEPPPGFITWVRWWDRAATVPDPKKKSHDPDWTVGALVGRTNDGACIIGDIVRMRAKPGDVETSILTTTKNDGRKVKCRLARDPGSAGIFEADYYVQALAGYDVEAVPETGDKETRARPLSAYAKGSKVKIVRAPWNRALLEEMESFPFGKKDQVDACANAFSQLFSDDVLARSRLKRAMAAARAAG